MSVVSLKRAKMDSNKYVCSPIQSHGSQEGTALCPETRGALRLEADCAETEMLLRTAPGGHVGHPDSDPTQPLVFSQSAAKQHALFF